MAKDTPEPTTAEIHAEAGKIMAAIPGGSGEPAPAFDPMQKAARFLRSIDETALRVWKAKPPKEMPGELAGYLFEGSVVVVHQLPSGKFVVYQRVNPNDLAAPDTGE